MILIIAHHIGVHSNFSFATDTISINKLWIQFIQMGGQVGVNVFVLISGYFLIGSKSIKTSKLLKLWLQIFLYSIVIFLIFVDWSQPLSLEELAINLLPVAFSRWWFASAYLVLYLLSPFLNKLLNSFTKSQYLKFLLLLFCIWCIIPTIFVSTFQSNSLLWFGFVYAVAGYIKLHVDISSVKPSKFLLIALITVTITYVAVITFDLIGLAIPFFATNATCFYDTQKLPILIISIALFLAFINLKCDYNPFINVVSSASFGVYLLHDNAYVRTLLWNTIFQNSIYQDGNLLIPYTLIQIITVFVVCTGIELFRIYVIEKSYIKAVDFLSNKIDSSIAKVLSHKTFNE